MQARLASKAHVQPLYAQGQFCIVLAKAQAPGRAFHSPPVVRPKAGFLICSVGPFTNCGPLFTLSRW